MSWHLGCWHWNVEGSFLSSPLWVSLTPYSDEVCPSWRSLSVHHFVLILKLVCQPLELNDGYERSSLGSSPLGAKVRPGVQSSPPGSIVHPWGPKFTPGVQSSFLWSILHPFKRHTGSQPYPWSLKLPLGPKRHHWGPKFTPGENVFQLASVLFDWVHTAAITLGVSVQLTQVCNLGAAPDIKQNATFGCFVSP
jgi:hypothetical protein